MAAIIYRSHAFMSVLREKMKTDLFIQKYIYIFIHTNMTYPVYTTCFPHLSAIAVHGPGVFGSATYLIPINIDLQSMYNNKSTITRLLWHTGRLSQALINGKPFMALHVCWVMSLHLFVQVLYAQNYRL